MACEHALGQLRESKYIYDVILVDEAQDFSSAFLKLCYELLNDPKRLVYAYDELQSLSGESLPSPEDIFGRNDDGSPIVPFNDTDNAQRKRDIILDRCYRNSRPVLVTAHALGFGIYRKTQKQNETGLVQMFDHPQLWTEVGYRLKDGDLRDGQAVVLERTDDTSPKFLENHSSIDDLIEFISFDSEEKQTEWLSEAIKENLKNDELRHDDIVVINPNPRTTREKVAPVRSRLLEVNIQSHLAGVDTNPDIFFQTNRKSVTFTGVFRAKGNEAGMVYIINAQDCHSSAWNLATIRNQLFTAITRSKAWIRVLGVGSAMDELKQEYGELRRRNFELQFTYPTPEQRDQLRIVHRDMTTEEHKRLQSHQKSVDRLIADLESGAIRSEDLDEDARARLREFLGEE